MPYLKKVKQLEKPPASCWEHNQVQDTFLGGVPSDRKQIVTGFQEIGWKQRPDFEGLWEDLTLVGVLTPKLKAGRKGMCSVGNLQTKNRISELGSLFWSFSKSHNLSIQVVPVKDIQEDDISFIFSLAMNQHLWSTT